MAFYRTTVTGPSRRDLTELVSKHRVVVVGTSFDAKRGFSVDAYLRPKQIRRLLEHGYKVVRHENEDQIGRKRQAEGRAGIARRTTRGRYGDVIWGGGYLSVDEVEHALVRGAKRFARYAELVPLPHRTWEKRRCHAFLIGTGRARTRPTVCFIGGVHGREWGSPDILVYFGLQLMLAYDEGRGIRLGKKKFTAAQIQYIVEKKGVVLFPQVNPDGRRFSMERRPFWRKNRRPAPRGRGPRSIGVDINRNFDFLWDYEKYFAPGLVASSKNPGDYETYVGPRAASEPETRNVVWLLDRFPSIRHFVDLHSYGETILYGWGTDDNQTDTPKMTFSNPAFDGKRGRIHDAEYREYMRPADQKSAVRLARRTVGAIRGVRGRKYRVQQSVGLYPTAGSSDDFVYSRHIADAARSKVFAFTIEWGRSNVPTPFHPPYPEMRKIMREVVAGLLEFCLQARAR